MCESGLRTSLTKLIVVKTSTLDVKEIYHVQSFSWELKF